MFANLHIRIDMCTKRKFCSLSFPPINGGNSKISQEKTSSEKLSFYESSQVQYEKPIFQIDAEDLVRILVNEMFIQRLRIFMNRKKLI